MTARALEVWCFGDRTGTLTDAADGLAFAYAPEWIGAGRPPLSQSLPLDGPCGTEAVVAFFGGLLPEGTPRTTLARQLGVSVENDFGLLEALGGDTAGAVSVVRPGEAPPGPAGEDVLWLTDEELAREIAELPTRPMHADEDGEYRLSLAGAQDKLPVVVGADGRVGLTTGRTPSTHIMKTPIAGLDDTVVNEAMCLDIGRRLGLDTVDATPRAAADAECLLVGRYDRTTGDDGTVRLHQEDFCQALGVATARKYQAEGGPTLPDCFALLRRATAVPAREAVRLLDAVALNFLVGNHDAHGKNFSLLYAPTTAAARFAPIYDVLDTVAYGKVRPMSRKMAMSIGKEYRPDYVAPRHLDALLAESGLGAAAARRRLRGLAASAPEAARAARQALVDAGWDRPVLGRIVETVDQRAGWLAAIAAPASRTR
ncbi:MAG TPA: type II toxin-antitoxin system HipA family toxin [Solirubrobacteraceae bacterium]|nr:type II toxin-antitoxin system HipA family toxin [Solirubrobacteraceae bacterium]